MTVNNQSAKILQFHARPRGTSAAQGGQAQVIELRPAPASVVYCPIVSYHEAAIAEEARARRA